MEIHRYTVSVGITYGWVTVQWLFEVSSVLIGHICRESVFFFIFQLSAQLAVSKESSLNISLPPKEGVSAEGGSEDNKTVEELWEIIR